MKKLSYAEMVCKLNKKFKNIEILDFINFDKDYKENFSIWVKNAQSVTYTEKDKNTLMNSVSTINQKLYDLDVYKKFDKFCQKYGWYVSTENYTLQLFQL